MVFFCSCATIHKNSSSSTNDQQHIDTSSQEHQFQKETVTEEKSTVQVTTDADSVQASGSISTEDTTEYTQTVETDDMSLTTTMKPKLKNGKVTGYDVNSKAKAKPKTVDIPIDKKTITKESGLDKQQTGITDAKKQIAIISSKDVHRLNLAGIGVIIGIVILVLLFIYFKFFR